MDVCTQAGHHWFDIKKYRKGMFNCFEFKTWEISTLDGWREFIVVVIGTGILVAEDVTQVTSAGPILDVMMMRSQTIWEIIPVQLQQLLVAVVAAFDVVVETLSCQRFGLFHVLDTPSGCAGRNSEIVQAGQARLD